MVWGCKPNGANSLQQRPADPPCSFDLVLVAEVVVNTLQLILVPFHY